MVLTIKLNDLVLQAIKASLPSGAEFVKVERATNTTKRNSYTMRIYATRGRTCVRCESNGIKAPGRGRNESQEWFFATDLTAEGYSAAFAGAAGLAERRQRQLADTGERKRAADTKDRSERRLS